MTGSYHIHHIRFTATVTIISIGPFICGISLGFSSSVSAQLLIGDNLIAFFSSLINLGALVGSLIVGPVLNTLGRRAALRISAAPSIIGWLLIAAAQGLSPPSTKVEPLLVSSLLLGRILSGLAAGMMTAVGSVYLVEVAPPHQSGRIGSLAQVATVAGTCFAYYCGMVATWYETAELMVLISVVLSGATFYLPESPAWLAKRNQMQAALRNLTWLRLDQKVAVQELSELPSDSSADAEKPPFLPQRQHVFRDSAGDSSSTSWLVRLLLPCVTIPPELSANLRIALLLMVAQQTTGINVITFYTEPLCQRMVHVTHSARCAFTLGLAQLFFSLLASFLIINRLPRRLLVVATGVLMSISMFFFAIGQQFPNSAPISPLAAILVFLLGYQCGWGPLATLIVLELFPADYRGAACSAAVAINWGVTFLVTQAFQPIVNLLDRQGELVVFVTHAVITSLASAYFHRRLPETNPIFVSTSSAGAAGALLMPLSRA
ncbi:Sugar transporter ERD6-like protein [Echinococcus granulosus]|uniref:Sugar transporter ERD6-like protein n=1 Tax=Echinococcus granulosus TaxID=6210 RepID=W6UTB0_ECHGR|nr:Sugar transporter ERD6-like protein [Echinococcus granulosus]EUB64518.1 Sugar transporter ERD6-like protein [Echinococcus granulosus]